MKETKREQAERIAEEQRIERMLDEGGGFGGAVDRLVKQSNVFNRAEMISVLRDFDYHLRSAIRHREFEKQLREMQSGDKIIGKDDKIGKLEALAADTRGNEHERAVARAKADKLRAKS